ncbi:MAG: hypothetical protein JEY79_01130 [Pseudodesulfovibrio sp.]|nr:hypothetical protein [Pseudodesulfovibrio sp.]
MEKTKNTHTIGRGQEFERELVELLVEVYTAPPFEMSDAAFSRAIFGDNTTSTGRWHRIKKTSLTIGKPQNLTVAQAVEAAAVLGMDFPSLAFKVFERLKMKRQA